MNDKIKGILITFIFVILALIHIIYPELAIDTTTIALLIMAGTPWFWKYIKSIELPGGTKINLKDIQKSSEKIITPKRFSAQQGYQQPQQGYQQPQQGYATPGSEFTEKKYRLDEIALIDPNVELIKLRIAIEKRIDIIVEKEMLDIKQYNRTLSFKINHLIQKEIISKGTGSGLKDLIKMGNQAAHGTEVTKDAALWAIQISPEILSYLDHIIDEKK